MSKNRENEAERATGERERYARGGKGVDGERERGRRGSSQGARRERGEGARARERGIARDGESQREKK